MNMQLMLGVATACYFISLLLICLYKHRINTKICNAVFIVADMIFFFCWNYAYAEKGWLDDGFMTLENISPFIFTVIPLTLFMNKKTKEFAFSAIAFLHLGMFLALFISPEYEVIFRMKTEATLAYAGEAICHMIASLFGLYLVLSGQVKADFSHWIKSIVFMLGTITFGVFLNLTLDTYCFNMNPNKYSIYMINIFDSFEATMAAYYLGVFLVLTLGMQSAYAFNKLVDKLHIQHKAYKIVQSRKNKA
ncbi:MAG: hypothetical protein IJY23_06430 [Clostridia bacterium]|nr:hypothetical protein [Clostridia bacterium]